MTLIDIRNQLITCLGKQSVFIMKDDKNRIKIDPKIEECRESLITAAFEAIEEVGLAKSLRDESGEKILGWVLTADLESYSQTLTISGEVANVIADTINTFLASHGMTEDKCNKLSINENDLMALVSILNDMIKAVEKGNSEDRN
jgi:predicted deacylase